MTGTITPPFNQSADPQVQARFFRACKAGDVNQVESLLLQYPEAVTWRDADDISSYTGLIAAAFEQRVDVVKVLLAAGAAVDAEGEDGETALLKAAKKDNCAIAALLLEAGADARKYHALPLSAAFGSKNFAAFLLDREAADIDAPNESGNTALILSIAWTNLDVMKLLLKLGADMSVVDAHGKSVMQVAQTSHRSPEIQSILNKERRHRDKLVHDRLKKEDVAQIFQGITAPVNVKGRSVLRKPTLKLAWAV